MNILILAEVSAHSVIGGAERVLREQAIGLQNRGHNVSLIVRAPESDPRPQVSIEGITEFRYPVRRTSAPAFVFSSILGSLRLFDQIREQASHDAVLIHQSMAGLGPILFRRKTAPNWVYNCNSLAHEEYLTRNITEGANRANLARGLHSKLRDWIEGLVIRRSRHVIVMSEFMKKRVICTHAISNEKIRLIPGAADVARFIPPADRKSVRAQINLPEDKIILFTVRNLVPRMGLENLIKAVEELGKVNDDILLIIGGEGPLRSSLEQLIHSLGLDPAPLEASPGRGTKVMLKGFISESDLVAFYQGADLVIMPTHALEGFGLVTVEALACGTPVLGTPVGATPEILSQIDPCLVSGGSDAHSLAKAMENIISKIHNDPPGWTKLSRKGRQLTEDVYNWEKHCERLIDIVSRREASLTPENR